VSALFFRCSFRTLPAILRRVFAYLD